MIVQAVGVDKTQHILVTVLFERNRRLEHEDVAELRRNLTVLQLEPQQQALLWLAYVEGFDHREIASTLQLREKSVRVLLYRARKRMAGILRTHGFGPPEA